MEEKNRIRLLSEATVNQIAAGEVVENAASVVKELIENAIDAKARFISIETKGAGRNYIAVKDNGLGMSREDLFLSIERHATSKITTVKDLDTLKTLGFRGEALSSIASISKMSIESATNESLLGAKISLEGEKVLSTTSLSRQRGTKVEVASLFFNVPARKKFLKSERIENLEIREVVIKAALANPSIGFEWIQEGHLEFSLKEECPLKERIALLLGREVEKNLNSIDVKEEAFVLRGFIGNSYQTRTNRKGQFLFINERPIQSLFVSKCVEEAYGTRLQNHRFPLFVLHLELSPDTFDVNVHPQKREVRFQKEEKLALLIKEAIKGSLEKRVTPPLLTKVFFPAPMNLSFEPLEESRKESASQLFFSLPKKERIFFHPVGPFVFCQENEGEVLVIDLVRAIFRVHFEKREKEKVFIPSQTLLFPITIEVSKEEKAILESHFSLLEKVGIHLRHFGNETFLVEAIPAYCEESEVKKIVEMCLEELKVKDPLNEEKKVLLALSQFLKGKFHDLNLIKSLVDELFRCNITNECPLGKPIYKKVTSKEVQKWF